MTNDEKIALIRKFRNICVKNWTSIEYNNPAYSKEVAEFKTMEVCLFLREALNSKRS